MDWSRDNDNEIKAVTYVNGQENPRAAPQWGRAIRGGISSGKGSQKRPRKLRHRTVCWNKLDWENEGHKDIERYAGTNCTEKAMTRTHRTVCWNKLHWESDDTKTSHSKLEKAGLRKRWHEEIGQYAGTNWTEKAMTRRHRTVCWNKLYWESDDTKALHSMLEQTVLRKWWHEDIGQYAGTNCTEKAMTRRHRTACWNKLYWESERQKTVAGTEGFWYSAMELWRLIMSWDIWLVYQRIQSLESIIATAPLRWFSWA